MFTGIIECQGTVEDVEVQESNKIFTIQSAISKELKVDQSVSHDGVCLTVVEMSGSWHKVCAVQETLDRTSLNTWAPGNEINLERCVPMGGRLDGHMVQGHVDALGKCTYVKDLNGSWDFGFSFDKSFAPLLVKKGSISINGVSLTIVDVDSDSFSVAIIPYTYHHTGFKNLVPGSIVNLEFDIVGKYISRHLELGLIK